MMIKKGILALSLICHSMGIMAAEPLLIDVKIIGSAQSPLFEPQHFQFDAGQDYLLVISNTGSDSITFEYGEFGQKVFTHSLQGASSLTQQSIVVNGNSKVQWLFSPKEGGEYSYRAINTALNARGNPGKITVIKVAEAPSAVENPEVAEQKPEENASDKKAKSRRSF